MLVISGVLNRFEVLADILGRLSDLTIEADILLIDNGSDRPLREEKWLPQSVRVVRNDLNTGSYPLFAQGLKMSDGHDILAFFHSDLLVHERGWDTRVRDAFARDERLGLLGFVGSSEIDGAGGRGLGTMLNFQGIGPASPAEVHGRRITDLRPAVVVDGCAMIFRRETLAGIGFRPGFPPHHFYDRLMSCQVLEQRWRIGVLGVACDHLGGETSCREPKWHALARQWTKSRGISDMGARWDYAVYCEAEQQFVEEWRDRKHFFPLKVLDDWTIVRS